MLNVTQREVSRGTVGMRLRLIEVVAKGEILVQKSQRNFWYAARNGAGLNTEILLLVPRTTELLEERGFNLRVPVCVSEPVVARHIAA